MISFVSHGDKTLQRLIGMPGEQEHHISSVPFFFFITYKILTCERALISAPSQAIKAPQNLRHYVMELRSDVIQPDFPYKADSIFHVLPSTAHGYRAQ